MQIKFIPAIVIGLLIFNFNYIIAQDLPRRVYLGIRMENLTEDTRRVMELKELRGVLISEVLPRSSAEKAGFSRSDILISINGTNVNSTGEVFSLLAGQSAGNKFDYEILRANKVIKGKSVFTSFPEEKYNGLEVIYTESESAIGLQRIIITKPVSTEKLPVIAFIGGIGCYSLDSPMDTARAEVQLLNMLSRAGYLCARLEKPGLGDNANKSKACNEVSLLEETEGYINAINKLKQRNDVDSGSVYIIGHSMGGVFAPLIAQKTSIKGVIAYGTIGSNFLEYLMKTRRTIAEAFAMSPEETDDLVKDFCECSSYYFVEKMSTEEAARKNPDCAEYLSIFDLRSRKYNDELYSFNIPGLWKSFTGKAAIVWGEADYIASEHDHKILVEAINYYHKGNAELITIGKSDHGMSVAENFSEAQKNPGPYNPEVGKTILAWLKKQS